MDTPTDTRGLVEALRRAGVREVDASTRRRAEYSSDASLYRVVPSAVVCPRDADEVAAVLAVCRETGAPLTARGAGTSIAGNAVGTGVVLDFSRHLNQVSGIDTEARTAVVQPGLILDDLQRRVQRHGLRFGPEPSTHSRCTLGGMIGNNSCGSRALAYGKTADNVVDLDILAGTGERLTATRGADPAVSPVLSAVHEVVGANLATIRTELGRFDRQVSGYSLEHLLPEHDFDVARALVGTEGSCGVLLGATVRLVESAATSIIVALGYPSMAAAADAVPALLAHRLISLEGLDIRIVDRVRAQRGAVPRLPAGQGWLFAELGGESVDELTGAAKAVIADSDATDALVVTDARQMASLWKIREAGAALSQRSVDNQPAYAGWEDAAVPPAQLGAYLRDFDALLAERGLKGMPYGHFGDGCMHVRIDFPLASGGVGVFKEFLTDAARLVASYGGSMSGEHGDGRARSALLPLMYSPAALGAFAAVKDAFDPDGILNPGVIVRPGPVEADLRVPAAPPVTTGLGFGYRHDHGDLTTAVHRCTGVGACRADNTRSGGVMCPSYVATRDEKDSTRGRSRVLQEAINGTLVHGLRSPEVRESLDLCLSCKGCSSDCPAGVDMATYKAEVLHQTYRRRPRPVSHYTLGQLPRWARLASRAPGLANAALRVPGVSTLAKRLAGVDVRRSLPTFADRTFRYWFAHRPDRATTGDPVMLWVDTFTDHFTPQVGAAAVRVLESAGFQVRLPAPGLCCGLTWITTGQLDAAKRILGRSVAALAPAVAEGVPVVGLEPSCTAVFRGDATELLDDEGAAQVAAGVHTLAELLARYRPDWTPPDLSGVTVVAQPHCHQHAVMGWDADRELLERAGATVEAVGGCCGLAGNFGVERGHYEVSVAVAESALLPAVRAAGGATVLADGFSCRTQLDDLADRPGVHLAQLLSDGRPATGS
ncbi:MAG: FAD-linked oxidase C-terminal domain-containing protein [Actinocatenispora sp.]